MLALCANLVVLHLLVQLGVGEVLAQAIAIVLVTPVNFVGNKLWSFRSRGAYGGGRRRARRSRRRLARAGRRSTAPVYDDSGRLSRRRSRRRPSPSLTEEQAVRRLLGSPKVAAWLERYPPAPVTEADFDRRTRRWRVHVWSGAAGEVASGVVDDARGRVLEAWTGPQVAWKMARGRPRRRSAGRALTSWPVWLALSRCLPRSALADLRRPLALRNLDLLALLSFGDLARILQSRRGVSQRPARLSAARVPARAHGVDRPATPAASPGAPSWPVWLLAAVAMFLVGLRVGLNVEAPRSVIDVGYAGVIGADRILDGQAPYGHMPVEESRTPCGPADSEGEIRQRIQVNGRCEAANPRGDTYGPFAYLAYVPAVATLGWSGRWDSLPAAHATAIALDLLTLAGLTLVGLRFGGRRLAATLAVAWAAYPFTAYALLANTNDASMPAVLVWGFWLVSSPWARGAAVALAGWSKFAALLLAPLWLAYPDGLGLRALPASSPPSGSPPRPSSRCCCSSRISESASRTFWDRTIGFQLDRESPFSLWGWGQYDAAGIPDLGWLRTVLQTRGRRAGRRRRVLAAPSRPARARGADRRCPARDAARPDALVLSLPALGTPLRGARRRPPSPR